MHRHATRTHLCKPRRARTARRDPSRRAADTYMPHAATCATTDSTQQHLAERSHARTPRVNIIDRTSGTREAKVAWADSSYSCVGGRDKATPVKEAGGRASHTSRTSHERDTAGSVLSPLGPKRAACQMQIIPMRARRAHAHAPPSGARPPHRSELPKRAAQKRPRHAQPPVDDDGNAAARAPQRFASTRGETRARPHASSTPRPRAQYLLRQRVPRRCCRTFLPRRLARYKR